MITKANCHGIWLRVGFEDIFSKSRGKVKSLILNIYKGEWCQKVRFGRFDKGGEIFLDQRLFLVKIEITLLRLKLCVFLKIKVEFLFS